jgi:uncharacterized membrane protein YjgN (DUF898 family)
MADQVNVTNNTLIEQMSKMDKPISYFDGTLGSYIGTAILSFLITVITLGIGFPWAMCMFYKWKTNHTVIEGRRLKFTGTASGLFGIWIKCILLIIITIGIYSFWVFIEVEKWKVAHTIFEN